MQPIRKRMLPRCNPRFVRGAIVAVLLQQLALAQPVVEYDGRPSGGFEDLIALQERITFHDLGDLSSLYIVARQGEEVLLDTRVSLQQVVSGHLSVGMIAVPVFGACEDGPTLFVQAWLTKEEGFREHTSTACMEGQTTTGYFERSVVNSAGALVFSTSVPTDRWTALQALAAQEAASFDNASSADTYITFWMFLGRDELPPEGGYPPLPEVETLDELRAMGLVDLEDR
jgi:hypothetical protein